jgi:hypothetical protein
MYYSVEGWGKDEFGDGLPVMQVAHLEGVLR